MERQRLAEWEKQRKAELTQHRQREQEKVLTLKAKQENLTKELDGLVSWDEEVIARDNVFLWNWAVPYFYLWHFLVQFIFKVGL